MSEILSFETYLLVTKEKFSINVLNKLSQKNLYKNEKFIENHLNEINYELLNNFLNDNIFIIESTWFNNIIQFVLTIIIKKSSPFFSIF